LPSLGLPPVFFSTRKKVQSPRSPLAQDASNETASERKNLSAQDGSASTARIDVPRACLHKSVDRQIDFAKLQASCAGFIADCAAADP
jgi:hypothetical protein